jgi:hypothetical protein
MSSFGGHGRATTSMALTPRGRPATLARCQVHIQEVKTIG